MDEHLSRRHITVTLMQSTRDSNEAGSFLSLLDLAPDGGCLAACIAACAGGLLHRLFTISLTPTLSPGEREKGEGSLFLWPDPTASPCGSPFRMLSGILPCGVRTFLDLPKETALIRPAW